MSTESERPRWWFAARRLYPLSRQAVVRYPGSRPNWAVLKQGEENILSGSWARSHRLVPPVLAPI